MMEEKLDRFTEELGCVMDGFCPKCSSIITEEKTCDDPEEWTVTCPICDYVLVFG